MNFTNDIPSNVQNYNTYLNKNQNTLSFGNLQKDNIPNNIQQSRVIQRIESDNEQGLELQKYNGNSRFDDLIRVRSQIERHHEITIQNDEIKMTDEVNSPKFNNENHHSQYINLSKNDKKLQDQISAMQKGFFKTNTFSEIHNQLAEMNERYTLIIQQLEQDLAREKKRNNSNYENVQSNYQRRQSNGERRQSNNSILSCIEEVSEYQSFDFGKSHPQNQQLVAFYKNLLKNMKNQYQTSLTQFNQMHQKIVNNFKSQLKQKNICLVNLENELQYYQCLLERRKKQDQINRQKVEEFNLLKSSGEQIDKNSFTKQNSNYQTQDLSQLIYSRFSTQSECTQKCQQSQNLQLKDMKDNHKSLKQIGPILQKGSKQILDEQQKYRNLKIENQHMKQLLENLNEQIYVLKLSNEQFNVEKNIKCMEQIGQIQSYYQKKIHEIYKVHSQQLKMMFEREQLPLQKKNEFQYIYRIFQDHIENLKAQIVTKDKQKSDQISCLKKYYQVQILNLTNQLNLDKKLPQTIQVSRINFKQEQKQQKTSSKQLMQQLTQNYELMERIQKLQQENRKLQKKLTEKTNENKIIAKLKQQKLKLQNTLVLKYEDIMVLQQDNNRINQQIASLKDQIEEIIKQQKTKFNDQLFKKQSEIIDLKKEYQKILNTSRQQKQNYQKHISNYTGTIKQKEIIIKYLKHQLKLANMKEAKENLIESLYENSIDQQEKKVSINISKQRPLNKNSNQKLISASFYESSQRQDKLNPRMIYKQQNVRQAKEQKSLIFQHDVNRSMSKKRKQQFFPYFIFHMNREKLMNNSQNKITIDYSPNKNDDGIIKQNSYYTERKMNIPKFMPYLPQK